MFVCLYYILTVWYVLFLTAFLSLCLSLPPPHFTFFPDPSFFLPLPSFSSVSSAYSFHSSIDPCTLFISPLLSPSFLLPVFPPPQFLSPASRLHLASLLPPYLPPHCSLLLLLSPTILPNSSLPPPLFICPPFFFVLSVQFFFISVPVFLSYSLPSLPPPLLPPPLPLPLLPSPVI